MKAFFRSVALWIKLAATCVLLLQPTPTRLPGLVAGIACMLCLPFAVALTWLAAASVPQRRIWLWPFWTVTVAGWSAVALLLGGRIAADTGADDRQVLLFGILAAAVVAVWLIMRTNRLVLWQALPNASSGLAVVAVVAGVWFWRYESKTAAIAAQAEARWAAIGLPMGEFEATLAPIPENSGSAVARQVFREVLNQRFYKPGTDAAVVEPLIPPSADASSLVTRASRIISAKLPPRDKLDVSSLPLDSLEPYAPTLEKTYRLIVAADAPLWACNPQDGPRIDVPNLLGIRMFSQLASAESLRRLAAGDEDGASLPLKACEKLGTHLESNPTLIALMLHVSVDSMLVSRQAWLPGGDVNFDSVGRDAARWRDSLVRSLQWDAWMMLHRAPDVANAYAGQAIFSEDEDDWGILRNLPEWTRPFVAEVYVQRQCGIGALHHAEHAAICRAPRTRALRDLGARMHDRVSSSDPTICDVNVSRVTKRIHASLLLREQVNLIRTARARLAAGLPVESRDSAVLRRARWELTADSERNAVSIRLSHAPKWVYDGDVTGPEFWVLPLDGSMPWEFGAREKTLASR